MSDVKAKKVSPTNRAEQQDQIREAAVEATEKGVCVRPRLQAQKALKAAHAKSE